MIVRAKERFYTVGSLMLMGEPGDDLRAWAERYVSVDPNFRWLLGNFVEADRANQNGHIFPLEELRKAAPTLAYKALNVLHRPQHCIGTFSGAQLVNPDGTELQADDTPPDGEYPVMESLAAMWVRRFPDEFLQIRGAHAEGALFYSHETVPKEVSCPTCEHRVPFAGLMDETYCEHMNASMVAPVRLHDPVFSGGAVIIPPVLPGWNRADMKKISAELQRDPEGAEGLFDAFAAAAAHLDAQTWEAMMLEVMREPQGQ